MGDDRVIMSTIGEPEDDERNLTYEGDKKILCRACDKTLLTLVELGGKPRFAGQVFVCTCPYCGDKSWRVKIDSNVMIEPPEGLIMEHDDFSIVDNHITHEIRMRKEDGN